MRKGWKMRLRKGRDTGKLWNSFGIGARTNYLTKAVFTIDRNEPQLCFPIFVPLSSRFIIWGGGDSRAGVSVGQAWVICPVHCQERAEQPDYQLHYIYPPYRIGIPQKRLGYPQSIRRQLLNVS